jgi:TPR repeat protein
VLGLWGFVPPGSDPDGQATILTEYMPHGSYQNVIDAERMGRTPEGFDATARFIVNYGIAVGMMVLHEHRIIHRDLKPDNILLDENWEPRVADFGLSKFVEAGQSRMQTMHAGTVPFMAPEIFDGDDYSFPVDVFAYGMLLYVALTGLEIFPETTNPYQHAERIRRGDRPPFPPGFDVHYQALIEDCWCAAPEARPTFRQIVKGVESPSFLGHSVDMDRFADYKARVVPADSVPVFTPPPDPVPRPVAVDTQPPKNPMQTLVEQADSGDSYAAFLYACQLRDRDLPDLPRAAQYFEMSARGGNPQGMIDYAICLELGRGVPLNLTESARWFKTAMDAGDIHGMYCYADMVEYGKGVTKDPIAAATLYQQAADKGHERAQNRIALFYEQGIYGIPRDLNRAARYFKMASDQGSRDGMFYYADMLEFGRGVPKDAAAAVRLYKLAAERNHSKAMGYLGFLMVQGVLVPRQVESGKGLIQKQIDARDATGYIHLGRIAEEGLDKRKDLAEAFACYRKAADAGISQGKLKVAKMMLLGQGTQKNQKAGLALFDDLITKQKNPDAMVELGKLYQNGEGVSRDRARAKELFRKAANLGSEAGRLLLGQAKEKK